MNFFNNFFYVKLLNIFYKFVKYNLFHYHCNYYFILKRFFYLLMNVLIIFKTIFYVYLFYLKDFGTEYAP